MKNFKSLVLAIIGMLALVICASIFSSCTQDEYLPETNQTEEFRADDQTIPETRAMNSTNMFNNVTSDGWNDIDQSILAYFQYWCQNTGFTGTTNYCVPTSFMMAVACLLNYHNASNKFNPSQSKLLEFASISPYDHVSDTAYVNTNFTNIDIGTHHYGTTTTERNLAKFNMENYLNDNYFVAVALKAHVSNSSESFYSYYNPDNPDLIVNYNYSSSNYIQNSGYTPHAVLVLRIDKFSTGNGIVTYIDPFRPRSSGSNRRYCLYSRFMDSMKFDEVNGPSGYYFTHIGYSGN